MEQLPDGVFGSFYPRQRAPQELLETVGLEDKARAYVRQLSGGQQRRFSVAAALVNDPEVLFLDEPTTGLDPQMRRSLWELLRRLNRDEGKTILLTTHYMEEAELLADRVAIIDQGRIKAIDTTRDLIARLDGVGHIEFATNRQVDIDELVGLAGVRQAAAQGNGGSGSLTPATYKLDITEPKTAVTSLLTWSEGRGVELRGLELTTVPDTLIVVGANAIGLELGQLFLHLGSQVTFVEALDRIAPFEEPEISASLEQHLVSLGAQVFTSATATKAGRNGDRLCLEVTIVEDTQRLEADQLLVATGRRAHTTELGLEAAGVDADNPGHIVVDDRMATTNPKVFAAGDVTNLPQFVYVAALSGAIAAEHALRGTSRRIDLHTMPRITFTSPPIASVGLTEAQAREAGHQVVTSLLPLEAVPRALVDHATTGLVKLIADETDGRLLGAHILAEGAGDVIQAAIVAMRHRATIDDIADTFHPYLTMAEALKLAAQGFTKDIKHLSCCAA